ncbi:MAG: DUF5686 family protein [Gemmatimonadetes bacterium]|nr:DUF5686 family protein [Gemmatimonadota bacterium]
MKALVPGVLALLATATTATPMAPQADRHTVQGVVYDTVSTKPVPFAVVHVAGTDMSTLTNRRGRFRLDLSTGDWELEVRKIGYGMASITVAVSRDRSVPDVFLRPLPVELAAVTVTAEADDPAMRIIREAIARKNDVLSRIHDYRYDAYVKFVVRDLKKHEDSTNAIVLVTETQTRAYWEQPDTYQETIVGRRQSSNLDAENNLVSVGQIVNFNRNRIDLQKYSVVSPTADDALDHYSYYLLDTLVLDGRTVFRLALEPKSAASPLFVGMIDIADVTFDVLSIDVGMNAAVRFDFLENLRYSQHMRDVGDDHWMPTEIAFYGEVHFGLPIPGFPSHMTFRHTVSLRDFRFDEGDAPAGLGEYLVVVEEGADDVDRTAWPNLRPEPLTETERSAYVRIDSLENRPRNLRSHLFFGAGTALVMSFQPDFFHFNRVEGVYLGAGATLRDLSPDLILRAKTGYSFSSDEWQYRFGAQYRVWERRRVWIGAEYRDDVVQRPTMVSRTYNPTHLALLGKVDPLDYYRETGFTISLSTKLLDFTRLQLRYNDFDQGSVPVVTDYSVFSKTKVQRDNPLIVDGRLRALSATFTYDSRPFLKSKGRDFIFNTLTYTTITIGGELASPSFIGNDFDYWRYFLWIHRRQRTLNMGLTTLDGMLGTSSGKLPPQRYFTMDFGNGVFFEGNGFNTLNESNFSGNRAAVLFASHDFDQQLFRRSRIPLIRDLPVTLSVHGGVFWTSFVEHTANPGDDMIPTAATGYGELGFGIGNLTPFLAPINLSAWFTWQLSSYDTKGFTFLIGVPGQ